MASEDEVPPTAIPSSGAGAGASATSPLVVEGEGSSAANKGKKRSAVWDDFEEVVVNNVPKIRCMHCKSLYTKSVGGSTSHLNRHRKSCAKKPRLPRSGQQLLSFTKSEGSASEGTLTTHKFEKGKLKEWFAKLIIIDEQPFKMVESEIFMGYSKYLNPQFEKVSRVTVKRECMKMYASEKMKLKAVLNSVSRVSLTSDMWTAQNQRKGYISLTAHYVDENWKLCKRILNFRHLPPPHSGLVISDCIYNCLRDWGIEKKVSSLTLDNASTNDSVIQFLRNQFKATDSLFFGGKIFHVRCCAHILNLIVQEGLKSIDQTIENVRESVKYIRGSPSRLSIWNDIVQRLNLTSPKTLKLDVCTRWNSTFEMLDSALELEHAFPEYAVRDRTYAWLPTDDDWSKAKEVHKFLKVFYDCTQIFSGNKFPTANMFLPSVWKIKDALKKAADDGPFFLQIMTGGMQMKFDKYWDDCHLIMSLAVVLDPRRKMSYVKYIFTKIYPTEKAISETSKVRDAIEVLYNAYTTTMSTQSASEVRSQVASRCDDEADFMSFLAKENTDIGMKESELDMYLKESVVLWQDSEFDVLEWWKLRVSEGKYLTLSTMARDILSIPISTVASESAFSTGSRVVSKTRSSLAPDTVEALICTQDWLRPMLGGYDLDEEEEENVNETATHETTTI